MFVPLGIVLITLRHTSTQGCEQKSVAQAGLNRDINEWPLKRF